MAFYICNNCKHPQGAAVTTGYSDRFFTDAPCPKCNQKQVTRDHSKDTLPQVNGEAASPTIRKHDNEAFISKNMHSDFRDFLRNMKKAHRGSNIKDW